MDAAKDKAWLENWRFENEICLHKRRQWFESVDDAQLQSQEWDALRFETRTKYGDSNLLKVKLVCREQHYEKLEG
ncbi:MAG: hypothetical protein K2X27_11740 [Candidatus Obscuribacterales bacterium]|nr:hypothetical protein [Candidatus Obscuribacterales bacterium]